MTSDVPDRDAPRRRTAIWLAVGAAALVAVIAVALLFTRGGAGGASPSTDAPDTGAAPGTPVSAAPSATETTPVPRASVPEATATGTPTVVPTQPTSAQTAPLDEKASLETGVAVEVSEIESVRGEARGPGEVAGPAVRVSIEVTNATEDGVQMDLALVNVYYGDDRTPASALSGPGLSPLPPTVGPGASAEGAYVFSVPEDRRDLLTVECSYSAEAPTVIFSGKA
jgi:hypothetical protein